MDFDPKNSDPFDVYRIRDYPQLNEPLNQLVEEVDSIDSRRLKRDQANYITHVKQLALNLFECTQTIPWSARGVSLDQNYYVKHSRYKALHLSFRHMNRGINALTEVGYAVVAPGYFDKAIWRGYATRIAPTEKLFNLFNDNGATLPMLEPHPNKEVIILRDSNKRNVEYEDTVETHRMRESTERCNEAMLTSLIDLEQTNTEEDELATRMGREDAGSPINLNRKTMARVFNNNSFEQGGRFYGPFWQNIPRESRPRLTINGKRTREVDFTGQHFVMMHAEVNSICPEDPYFLRGFDTPEGRKKIKLIANIMVNACSRRSVLSAMKGIIPDGTLPRIYRNREVVLSELERCHRAINRFFYTGYGVNMQYKDSVVAEKVMLQMIEHSVTPLTVHDSFIVDHNRVDTLKDVMHQKFEEVTGVLPSTKASQYVFETIEQDLDISPEANVARLLEIKNLLEDENNSYSRYQTRKSNWYDLHPITCRP